MIDVVDILLISSVACLIIGGLTGYACAQLDRHESQKGSQHENN